MAMTVAEVMEYDEAFLRPLLIGCNILTPREGWMQIHDIRWVRGAVTLQLGDDLRWARATCMGFDVRAIPEDWPRPYHDYSKPSVWYDLKKSPIDIDLMDILTVSG